MKEIKTMKLAIIKANNEVEIVVEDIEEFNLDKPMVMTHIAEAIAVTIKANTKTCGHYACNCPLGTVDV